MDTGPVDVHLRQTLETVTRWHGAFASSPQFGTLSESQQAKAGAITEWFGRHAYNQLGLLPGEWTRSTVYECCTEILPRKVSADLSFFEAVAPVLSAFFDFLDSQSLLHDARSLAEVAGCLHEEILAKAREQRNWGPAKRFVMAALEAGVDIHDSAALQAFMIEFNLRQFLRSQFTATRYWRRPDWQARASGTPHFIPPGNPHESRP